jgi:hypothetical protein
MKKRNVSKCFVSLNKKINKSTSTYIQLIQKSKIKAEGDVIENKNSENTSCPKKK